MLELCYFSQLWNRVVKERLALSPRPLEGDLVLAAPGTGPAVVLLNPKTLKVEATVDVEPVAVRVLTAEDITARTFSMKDVLLPLPGRGLVLPTNAMAERYEALLAADGITLATVDGITAAREPLPPLAAASYRPVVNRPEAVAWEFFEGETGAPLQTHGKPAAAKPIADAKQLHLRLSFQLSGGATNLGMLTRELLQYATKTARQTSTTRPAPESPVTSSPKPTATATAKPMPVLEEVPAVAPLTAPLAGATATGGVAVAL
jgi:tRNA pseudouridine13 synthase